MARKRPDDMSEWTPEDWEDFENWCEYQEYQDHPERDRGEQFQDRYDMFRNEY